MKLVIDSLQHIIILHLYLRMAYSMGIDKAFHLYLSTIISSVNYRLYLGAGFNKKNAIILTATNTMLIGFTKEWIDAHIDVGGFSWIDMLSNMVGVGGALYQEHLWNHQKIIFNIVTEIVLGHNTIILN